METIENTTFQGEAIMVDGKQFKSCLFEECTLVFAGGELPEFQNCQFENISMQFDGAAAKTLKFLSGLSAGGFSAAVENIIGGVRAK